MHGPSAGSPLTTWRGPRESVLCQWRCAALLAQAQASGALEDSVGHGPRNQPGQHEGATGSQGVPSLDPERRSDPVRDCPQARKKIIFGPPDHSAQPAGPSTDACTSTGTRRLAHRAVPCRTATRSGDPKAFPPGINETGETPSSGQVRACYKCTLLVPHRSSEKGVAPVHLRNPRSATRVRRYGRNHQKKKEIGEIVCVSWQTPMM